MIIKYYIPLDQMTEKQKERLAKNGASTFSDITFKMINKHLNTIKDSLSQTNKTLLKKSKDTKNISYQFLLQIFSKLSEDILKELFLDYFKSVFKGDNELYKKIKLGEEISEKEFCDFLIKHDGNDRAKIESFVNCFNSPIEISEEIINESEKDKKIEDLEGEIKKLNEKVETLKTNLANEKNNTALANEDVKKYKSERDDLEREFNKLKSQEALRHEEKIKKEEKTQEVVSQEAKPKEKEIKVNNIETKTPFSELIDFDESLDDFENRTLLGIVKPGGIFVNNGWVVVTPINPIFNEDTNIDKQKFEKAVDYRGDYSSFFLKINTDFLNLCLKKEADDYFYCSNEEKFELLYRALVKKIIFFAPEIVSVEGSSKYKLNARILSEPIPYRDFDNSTFVPYYKSTKKDFEALVINKGNICLKNYPVSLASKLNYILVGDTIYKVNYVPSRMQEKGEYIVWQYKSIEGQPPYKKLDLKITANESEKYLRVPFPGQNLFNDVYVKNNVFIETSKNKKVIFDEGEFINQVKENAVAHNIYYDEFDLKAFHVAVKSSSLVILAGPSGIGKTRLPFIYANTLGLDPAKNTVLFVPISPSYVEPEDVLGYIRPISEEKNNIVTNKENEEKNRSNLEENLYNNNANAEFIESQTGLVSFLKNAADHKDKLHLVVFDEMNLSQIEYWFAPFISLLEQDEDNRTLNLFSKNLILKNGDKYESSINIGKNVVFIGTINIDETTKAISDRLLDRAILINLAAPSFTSLKEMKAVEEQTYSEVSFSKFESSISKVGNPTSVFTSEEFDFINKLNELLINSNYGKGISFRSLRKIALYLKNSESIFDRNAALDFVIAQIVIKKIGGQKEELDEIINDDNTQGIFKLLNEYNKLSDFAKSKKELYKKAQELNKYGFTK